MVQCLTPVGLQWVFSENGVLHLFIAGRRKWIADMHGDSLLKQ